MTPNQAYNKAYDAGKRLPELEDIIMTSPWYSYLYSECVIQGRWIEAEDVIMISAYCSLLYARAIRGKLPEKMHNMMILHAIRDSNSDDRWVKYYFEYIAK